jgi:hypothetical protein
LDAAGVLIPPIKLQNPARTGSSRLLNSFAQKVFNRSAIADNFAKPNPDTNNGELCPIMLRTALGSSDWFGTLHQRRSRCEPLAAKA